MSDPMKFSRLIFAVLTCVTYVFQGQTTAAVVTAAWDPVDATDEIRAAINAAGAGGTVIIPAKSTPWFVREKYGGSTNRTAILLDKPNLTFRLADGATIKARKNFFKGVQSTLFRITANGVKLRGAGIGKSRLVMRKSDYQSSSYQKSQFRSAVDVGGYKDITIQDLSINHAGGDGINIGGYFSTRRFAENLLIYRVSIWEAHRNGISISSAVNSRIDRVSIWNTRGTDPESAVDVELDHTYQRVQNVVVSNSSFGTSQRRNINVTLFNYHNNSIDKGVSPSWVSVLFDNCTSYASVGAGIRVSGPSGDEIDLPKGVADWAWISFKNCDVDQSGTHGVELAHTYADTGIKVQFQGCSFNNSGQIAPLANPVRMLYGKNGYRLGDIRFFGGCKILDDRSVDTVWAPNWLRNIGFKDINGTIDVTSAAGPGVIRLGNNLRNVTLNLQ